MKLKYRCLLFVAFVLVVFYVIAFRDSINLTARDSSNVNESVLRPFDGLPYKGDHGVSKTTVQQMYTTELSGSGERRREVALAVVVCGDRLTETLVMLKSAILFASRLQHGLRIVIVTEDQLSQSFSEKLGEWQAQTNGSFEFELHGLSFPTLYGAEWRGLFKPCAAQRLFLPTLLPHLERVLYVDTDTIFLAPLTEVWRHFDAMNSSQMAALCPEHEDPSTGWYNRFARHPYYGKMGVNSGVMLMHLTRMRSFGWAKYLAPIYREFRLKLTWGDQDIINILFHFHPERLLVYSCAYNFRPDHCMYMSMCRPAERAGVAVVHGSRGSFHGEKQPAFRAVYRAMEEYQLALEPHHNLLLPMKSYLDQSAHTNCGKVRAIFTRRLEQTFPKPVDYAFR